MYNEIKIVVGSWGSYNACNKRALGSEWICLNDFECWEDIEEELTNQGFELNGLDEELFIQDIEGIDCRSTNWDYMHPKRLFETLKESEVLDDVYKFKVMEAYIEINNLDDFFERVDNYGSSWDDDIYFYEDMDMEDVARQIVEDCYNLPEIAERYFDYKAFARDLSYDGCFYETSCGVIEIR